MTGNSQSLSRKRVVLANQERITTLSKITIVLKPTATNKQS